VPERLFALRALGFQNLLGIDPFLTSAGDWPELKLRKGSIHDCPGTYQLVMLHHSFEHAPDPLDVMASIRRLLRPGGVAVIRTPVMGTWFWRTFGPNWVELDPPRHLFVHTMASLSHCASAAGLRVHDVVWDSHAWEIIASDQIAKNVAWRDQNSWATNPPAGYAAATIRAYADRVTLLNRGGDAGRAAFYLLDGSANE
jgi:SAM-dependent methyltransferase